MGSAAGIRYGQDQRHGRLNAKVDGKQLGLHGGKLRPRQGLELDEAIDERLRRMSA